MQIDSKVSASNHKLKWKLLLEKLSEDNPNFIISAGDQIDFEYSIISEIPAVGEADFIEKFKPGLLRHLPFAPAIGNHDVDPPDDSNSNKTIAFTTNNPFRWHYKLPNELNYNVTEYNINAGNYYFRINNVLFVALNTRYTSAVSTLPARWENCLSSAKAANTGQYDWIVVFHHIPTINIGMYSTGGGGGENNINRINIYKVGFEAMMDKHGVDFVLAGHEHIYARSHAIKTNKEIQNQLPNGGSVHNAGGTVYMTANTASGIKYYSINLQSEPYIAVSDHRTLSNTSPGMYILFEVNGKSFNAKAYYIAPGGSAGSPNFNNSTKTMLDSFTLTKS